MATESEYIVPDSDFVKQIISLGGESLKQCFQCGSCSVVCSLSPQQKPFPRKEMLWMQWGLKDRLLKDPDIWLCHNCNDCSTYCPRGVKPGDVLAAIRNYAIVHLAVPTFLAKAFSKLKYLPAFFAVPVIIFLALFVLSNGGLRFPEGEVVFSNLIPYAYVVGVTSLAVGFALVVAIIGMLRFWKNISEFDSKAASLSEGSATAQVKKSFIASFGLSLIDILKHSNFAQCGINKIRYYAHLSVFYGFALIMLSHLGTGLYLITGIYQMKGVDSYPPLTDPVKIVGNLGFVLLLTGCLLIFYNRISKKQDAGRTTYFDWFFIALLSLVTLGGVLTEAARILEMTTVAYIVWLFHEILVFTLLAYLPFSKFAHLFYRTLAMTYAKQMGREAKPGGTVE